MISANIADTNINFDRIGWRYYNKIKKKAMEQEFSVSGLLVSLSIAFFIVVISAVILNGFYVVLEKSNLQNRIMEKKLYQLEILGENSADKYLQRDFISQERLNEAIGNYIT